MTPMSAPRIVQPSQRQKIDLRCFAAAASSMRASSPGDEPDGPRKCREHHRAERGLDDARDRGLDDDPPPEKATGAVAFANAPAVKSPRGGGIPAAHSVKPLLCAVPAGAADRAVDAEVAVRVLHAVGAALAVDALLAARQVAVGGERALRHRAPIGL